MRLIALLTLLASGAHAGCGPTVAVEAKLQAMYGETILGYGLRYDRMQRMTVVKVWKSPNGTMTVTEGSAEGVTCILMSSVQFQLVPEALPPKGDPL